MKAGLFREIHIHRQNAVDLRRQEQPWGAGVISFYGLGNLIVGGLFQLFWGKGGHFQKLGHSPLFGLLRSALELSWRLCITC